MSKNLQTFQAILFASFICLINTPALAQENRTFDGSNNNLQHTEWGATGTNQLRVTPVSYSDAVSAPAGLNRPNPRFISNTIFNQESLQSDVLEMSDYAFVWGQFIDHDITLVGDDHSDAYPISVPMGDPYFDPFSTGNAQINFARSASDPSTGTSPNNPREFPNLISSFIDASNVYGETLEKANWLRTFVSGKLKMSAGNFLPYNTITGQGVSPIDFDAPEMAMPNPTIIRWFVAGDVRANENVLLTSIHTLFAREHNRICDELKDENPTWSDEEIYQRARKFIGAKIQAIVYEEWLPTLGVNIGEYVAYDPVLNPGIMNVFSVAAYRYGHTVINSEIIRMNNNGDIIPEGNILLRDAFFNPIVIVETGGIDPFFIGMGTQIEQDLDCKLIHDLRNFLFGTPGAGGLDLASINIQRGRERGLVDFNATRQTFGLTKYTNFNQISDNVWFNQIFEDVYVDINDIDPWVGILAESHMDNALFGETAMAIMARQFRALRDGDRFYFENDPAFSQEEIAIIKQTTFKDIIMSNTGVNAMQENVFLMSPHSAVGVLNKKEEVLRLDVYPNPVAENLFINISAPKAGEALIQIRDIKGVLISESIQDAAAGMNTFEFKIDQSLPSGFYLISLIMDNRVGHKRIFKN